MTLRSKIASSRFARAAALPGRAGSASRHLGSEAALTTSWLVTSREHHNYTYNLSSRNVEHLAWWVATVTGAPPDDCRIWIAEALDDKELASHVQSAVRKSPRRGLADREVRIGRRAGWYAAIRALRPDYVVETGTDKGLGSVVIASALIRNGHGHLTTMDINPDAGYLVSGPFAEVTSLAIGDSIKSISEHSEIDLFIHDSDHSPEHETRELAAVQGALRPGARVLSDNSHATDSLVEWARGTNRKFLFFHEIPDRHWYPGAGIGAAW
jgi:predicted O-methyltransferase YrrM